MNPIPLSWTLIAGAILVTGIVAQSWRLDNAQGRIRVFEEREAAQKRDQARRELHNAQAKERANENYDRDRKRAALVVVRPGTATVITDGKTFDSGSGEKSTACVVRGELERTLAEFAQWHGAELARLATAISQRHAREATHIARTGETLSAAYRAARDYALEVE